MIKNLFSIFLLVLCAGCTLVTNDRVFPKLTWYWSAEAKQQRAERQQSEKPPKTNQVSKVMPPEPPMPSTPARAQLTAVVELAPTPPVHTNVISATFPAQCCCQAAYFQVSDDLHNWRTIYAVPYPSTYEDTILTWTNVDKGWNKFFRAGISY